MISEEQLVADFQKMRQVLEEKENDISRYQHQGQQLADETFSELQSILSTFENSDIEESLYFARKELIQLEENFKFEVNREKKKLSLQQEELEGKYRQDILSLKNK